MQRQRIAVVAVLMVTGVALTGCSGGSSDGTTLTGNPIKTHHHHKTATPTPTPTASTPTPQVTVTVTGSPTTTPTSGSPQNLTVTPTVRKQLIKAGAKSHELPASDYTGLAPGRTYYAYDPATTTYWAGGALVPSSASEDAQISVQDDGSYTLFERQSSGGWVGYNVGLAGFAGATCQVKPPKSITTIWHWAKGSCRPPS